MTVYRSIKPFGMAVLLALVAACQQYALLPADKTVEIGKSLSVKPTSDWSRHGSGASQVWTIDGPMLERVIFSVDSEYGDPMMRLEGADGLPTYEENSSPADLLDGFVVSMEKFGFSSVTVTDTNVASLGGQQALRVDFEAETADNPRYQGIAYLIDQIGKYHMAVYWGTKLYHFEKSRAEFVNMMNAVHWSDAALASAAE